MVSQHVNSVHTYSLCINFGEECLFICLLEESKFKESFIKTKSAYLNPLLGDVG